MRKTYMVLGAGGLAVAATALLVWQPQQSPEPVISTAPVVAEVKAPAAPTPPPETPKEIVVTSKPATSHVIRKQPVAVSKEVAKTSTPPAEPSAPVEAPPRPAPVEPASDARPSADKSAAGALIGTFTLIHDHSNGNFEKGNPKATCVGELAIFENELRFDAPDAQHAFSANWTEVRDAGSNKFFGSGIGGFHVTITADGKYRNFNLAPQSKDKAEAKQVLDLLKAHARKSGRTK